MSSFNHMISIKDLLDLAISKVRQIRSSPATRAGGRSGFKGMHGTFEVLDSDRRKLYLASWQSVNSVATNVVPGGFGNFRMAIPTWRPKLMKSIMNLFRRCGHGMTRKGLTRGKDKIRFNLINIINNSDPSWKALQSPRGRVSDMVRLGSTNQIVPSVNNINGLGLGIDQTVQRGFSRLAGTSMQKVQTQLRTCRQLLQRIYIYS